MERAYSLFNLKSVDDEQRIIEGLASTPEPDRQGDVMESAGAKFTLPMPLLWQHRPDQPLGHVLSAKVSEKGIEIKAQIAKGIPFIEDAWALMKKGLVSGLSIGWLPIDAEPVDRKNPFSGTRVKAWEWFELSAVTVPANSKTTISRIKSLDVEQRAALVEPAPVTPPRHVVVKATRTQKRQLMKTYSEQISAFEATRAAKAGRMSEVQAQASKDGRSKDEGERTEFDQLKLEIKAIDDELVDLRDMDRMNREAAIPVMGATPAAAAAARSGIAPIQVKENTPPGIGFARAIMCKMQAFQEYRNAAEIAKERYPHDVRVQQFLTKAVVNAANTTDATYMGGLVDQANLATEFIDFLRPMTIVDRIPGLTRVPFNIRVMGQTTGGAGYWVGQGSGKPLTKFGVAPTTLSFAKVAAISVVTEELARFSTPSAERLVRDGLAAALIERLDIDFIDPAKAAVANVSPASITNGITGTPATGDPLADLAALLSGFLTANLNPADLVFIMPNSVALVLALMTNASGSRAFPDITMNGGSLLGIPVVASQYAATIGTADSAVVILANAKEIFLADDGQVSVDVSREASLEMTDSPTQSANTGTGASLVSMFQTNSIALRAERFITWARRRPQAVAWLDAVGYEPTPPADTPATAAAKKRREA